MVILFKDLASVALISFIVDLKSYVFFFGRKVDINNLLFWVTEQLTKRENRKQIKERTLCNELCIKHKI